MTSKLYEFFYKETPEEREREYLGDLLVQPRTTKEIRAYVLSDYLLGRHQKLSEDLFKQRAADVSVGHAHLDAHRTRDRAPRSHSRTCSSRTRARRARSIRAASCSSSAPSRRCRRRWATSRARSWPSTSTRRFSTTTSRSSSIEPLRARAGRAARAAERSRSIGIDFDNVTFTYPGGIEPAVSGLNLHIRGGELVALVGENGAGKSTLVKLLLRFYDADRRQRARRRRRREETWIRRRCAAALACCSRTMRRTSSRSARTW